MLCSRKNWRWKKLEDEKKNKKKLDDEKNYFFLSNSLFSFPFPRKKYCFLQITKIRYLSVERKVTVQKYCIFLSLNWTSHENEPGQSLHIKGNGKMFAVKLEWKYNIGNCIAAINKHWNNISFAIKNCSKLVGFMLSLI